MDEVVGVEVSPTDGMNKYSRRRTEIPLVGHKETINDGRVGCEGSTHRLTRHGYQQDAVKRAKGFAPVIRVVWVQMAQSVLRYKWGLLANSSKAVEWLRQGEALPEEFVKQMA